MQSHAWLSPNYEFHIYKNLNRCHLLQRHCNLAPRKFHAEAFFWVPFFFLPDFSTITDVLENVRKIFYNFQHTTYCSVRNNLNVIDLMLIWTDLKLHWFQLFSLKMIKERSFCDVDWFNPLICSTCQGQQCQGHHHHHHHHHHPHPYHCKTQIPLVEYGKITIKFHIFFLRMFPKASDLLYDCLIATSSEWISRPKDAKDRSWDFKTYSVL